MSVEENKVKKKKTKTKRGLVILLIIIMAFSTLALVKPEAFSSIGNIFKSNAEGISLHSEFGDSNSNLGTASIISSGKAWTVTRADGLEANLKLWTANAKDKKTEIGFKIPKGDKCSDPQWKTALNVYDDSGASIKNSADGKDIKPIACKSAGCGGQDCYYLSLTTAQSSNLQDLDYIKLGENSFVAVYQDQNLINYNLGWANVNVSLSCEGVNQNDLFIFERLGSLKFGANGTFEGLKNCSYVIKSNFEINRRDNIFYLKNPTVISNKDNSYYEFSEFYFDDICLKDLNGTSPNCNFEQWEEDGFYLVNVSFISDKNIDPNIRGRIEIIKAEHLNETRDFIKDIYDEVKARDYIWSDKINNSQYARVTFALPLDNSSDITIYARGGDADIEVYEKDSSTLLATFNNVSSDGMYKIYLTELDGVQDVFDLKTIGDYVEYDYIVDPTNSWICSASANFTNTSCWSLGTVPLAEDDVVFDNGGVGNCYITNNTMPQNLNSFTVSGYTGTIYFYPLFAVGTWGTWAGSQLWNVTNNIVINGGTMKIYGDAYNGTSLDASLPFMRNITADGHGQEWRSVSGNISVGAPAHLDGVGLGFKGNVGPGNGGGAYGASHGGKGGGGNSKSPYGNASAPTSLGCGGSVNPASGGSGIKLHADTIIINGFFNFSGTSHGSSGEGGSGGSIWLKANNISGTGIIKANGGLGGYDGGGGRIRLEYGSSMSFNGFISVAQGVHKAGAKPGTLTFTNNTWPGDWNLTGNIGLLGGDFGDGATINVLGNFNTNNYNITIYGDCFYNKTNPVTCYNKTADGRGVWINASGNITVTSGSVLDGVGLGFPLATGPGYLTTGGSSYGGKGGGVSKATYGNETAPTSLGSSGQYLAIGGSAIKLQTDIGNINIGGIINVMGTNANNNYGATGGSIWLKANNITGSGILNASGSNVIATGGHGGGGGRVALTSSGTISYSGIINNLGGRKFSTFIDGSGGTVYINATTSISLSGNISVAGFNGSSVNSDWGQRINISAPLITLSGVYNATRYNSTVLGTVEGAINVRYTDCSSDYSLGIFQPNPNVVTSCTGDLEYPLFSSFWDNNASLVDSGIGIFNVTLLNTNGSVILYLNNTNITASNTTTAWNIWNASHTFEIGAIYPYYWMSYGNGTSHLFNKTLTRYYSVNVTPPDIEYPLFSNFSVDIANGSQYFGGSYPFNTTIIKTNGTTGLEFNGVNISLTNVSNRFTGTKIKPSAGVYDYYYWAYGNGTSKIYNTTKTYSYTILQNQTEIYTYLNHTRNNVTIQKGSQVAINSTLQIGDFASYIQVYNNGTLLNNGTSPLYNLTQFGSLGDYNITSIYPKTENYTEAKEMFFVKVRDFNASNVYLMFPANASYQGSKIWFEANFTDDSALSNAILHVYNGTIIFNNTESVALTGTYDEANITAILPDGNYSFNFYSCDTSSNCNFNATNWSFVLDTLYPKITYQLPTPANNYYSNANSFPVNVSIIESNLANITFEVYNSTKSVNLSESLITNYLNFTSLPDDIYYYNITVIDRLNRKNTTITRILTIDTLNPKIKFVEPTREDNNVTTNLSIVFNVSLTELNLLNFTWNWNKINYTIYDTMPLLFNFNNLSALGENNSFAENIVNPKLNATLRNVKIVQGKYGKAIELNNSPTVYGNISGTDFGLDAKTPVTFLTWVKMGRNSTVGPLGTSNPLIDNVWGTYANGWQIQLTSSAGIQYLTGNDTSWSKFIWFDAYLDTNWHHLAFVSTGALDSRPLFYIDGVNYTNGGYWDGSSDFQHIILPTNPSTNTIIGGNIQLDPLHMFNGSIDELKMFKKALTIEEIQQEYYSTIEKFNSTDYIFYTEEPVVAFKNYTYQACALDKALRFNCTETRNVNITITADTEYPQFSNFYVNPANASVWAQGQNYTFNVSILSNNGTAGLEFNGVNISIKNISSIFSGNRTNLGAGIYTYYYWSFGNGTNHWFNRTADFYYTINRTSPIACSIASNSPKTYPSQINVSGNCFNPETSAELWKDNINVTSQLNQLVTLGAGTYTYIINSSTTQNYTSSTASTSVTVNIGSHSITMTINGVNAISQSIVHTQGTETNLTCQKTDTQGVIELRRDNSIIMNGSTYVNEIDTLTAGNYTYNCTIPTTQNYSAVMLWAGLNITIVDTTPPIFTNCRNLTGNVNQSFSQSITATDISGIDTYSLNDTTNFSVSNAGLITNNTGMFYIWTYHLNLTANDTYNNAANCLFNINITSYIIVSKSTVIKISPDFPNTIPYIKFGRNLKFN